MVKTLITLFLVCPFYMFSQHMDNERLHEIYSEVSDSLVGKSGKWQLFINEVGILSLTDESNNRMRIISPIMDAANLNEQLMQAALVANFHTALDVKYAVSDGVLWSVFIHPLKELTTDQVKDALRQVYFANVNFGTTFTSTSLTFPPSRRKDKEAKTKQLDTIRKF